MKNLNKIIIYTLADPNTGEIKYVGKTSKTLEERIVTHIRDAKYKQQSNKRLSWIKKLLNNNLIPKIEEIEIIDEKFGNEIEIYWISQFRAWGFNLKNMTEGGDGGKLSIEVRKKISKNTKGKKRSQETKDKMSKSKKGTMMGEKNHRYGTHTTGKIALQFSKNGYFIKQWNSLTEAAETLNLDVTNISRACRGERKGTGGFKWFFK